MLREGELTYGLINRLGQGGGKGFARREFELEAQFDEAANAAERSFKPAR